MDLAEVTEWRGEGQNNVAMLETILTHLYLPNCLFPE